MRARSSLPALLAAIVGLVLAACGQPPTSSPTTTSTIADLTPPDPESDAAPTSAMADMGAVPAQFGGRWFVSAAYPTGARAASKSDPHLGVSLVIEPAEVSDVNGQRCLTPEFRTDRSGPEAGRLGKVALDSMERLNVACKGKAFATLLLLPQRLLNAVATTGTAAAPHALLVVRPEAHYLLERAEQILLRQAGLRAVPAAESPASQPGPAAEAPIAAPTQLSPDPTVAQAVAPAAQQPVLSAPLALAPEPPVPATAAPAASTSTSASTGATPAPQAASIADTPPAPGSAIHLASYAGISAAKRGWKILLGDFDVLDPMSPLYVNVDVPGKGPMVRLYATGGSRAQLDSACAALQAQAAYCQISR